ncbi:MAG: hypothetical protein J5367_05505 [Lachnospiraceae bacterium]|nr:hypothetical protein [Lachnospiraceae bacterium]
MIRLVKRIFRDFNRIHWIICIILTAACISGGLLSISHLKGSNVYDVDFRAIQQKTDPDGTGYYSLRGLSLRKGNYKIMIGYESTEPSKIEIFLDNDISKSETLPMAYPDPLVASYAFELNSGTDRGSIEFTYPAGATLHLANITIVSDKPLYYDALIKGVLVLLLIPCIWAGMYFYIHSTHKISLVIAVLIVIFQAVPFFLQGDLHLGVDTRGHMMRIEGIYYGLLDGQFPVVIYPEWNNSYGQLGVLYPNMFLYIPAIFRLLGASQLAACKIFMFLTICISTVVALASARTIFKREWQIIIVMIVICFDNTHLIDMLSAGRIGGAVLAEIFYPLVVAGIIEVFYRNRKKWYLLAYGVAGVFNCHVMSATIICIAILILALFNLKKFADPHIRHSIYRAIILFTGLVLGVGVCFANFYFSDWGQENLQWKSLLDTLWPKEYGLADRRWIYSIALMLIAISAVIIVLVRKRYDLIADEYFIPVLICGIILVLMSTVIFPWKLLVNIPAVKYYANMIQSSHRFLSPADAFLAFSIGGLLDTVVVSKPGRRSYHSRTVGLSAFVIFGLCVISTVTGYYSYFVKNSEVLYYDPVIGEIESTYEDYLPAGTKTEWYSTDTGFVSDEDAVTSLDYERRGTYVYYAYTNKKEGSYVEFPRFYYNGYIAVDKMSEPVEVVKGDHNRTRVYLEKTDAPAIVRMWYHVPKFMTFACSVSFGLWIASLMLVGARIYYKID